MINKKRKKILSIRNSIIIYFTVTMLTTVIIIGNIIFSNWISSTIDITQKTARDINYEIIYQINNYLDTSEKINEDNYKLIENDVIDMNEGEKRNPFLIGILENNAEYIESFHYATEENELYGIRKSASDSFELYQYSSNAGGMVFYTYNETYGYQGYRIKKGSYDERTNEWYMAGKNALHSVYSPVHKHPMLEDYVISIAHPVLKKDGTSLRGVISSNILLSNIDNYLEQLVATNEGSAIIFEQDTGAIIASSLEDKNFKRESDGSIRRSSIYDANNLQIWQIYSKITSESQDKTLITTKEGNLYVNLSLYGGGGLNWVILSAIPDDIFLKHIYKNIWIACICGIITLMLALIVYNYIARKLIKPIKTLLTAAERFSEGDLTQRVKVIRDDEIGKISAAFNTMADKMYELVHNLEAKVKERTLELEQTNDTLNKTKDELYLILDSTAEGIFGIDLEGRCTFCNNSCLVLMGYEKQSDLLGRRMHDLIQSSYLRGDPTPFEESRVYKTITTGEKAYVTDEIFCRVDGTSIDVEYYSYPQYKNGRIIGAVITFMDVTERNKTAAQIRYLSCHDTLTGLMNRSYLEEALIMNDTEHNLPVSIIFADLNGLKLVNDVFGHATGDNLIKRAGDILKRSCRATDIIARVGGDEFIILLPSTSTEVAQRIIDRIKLELRKERVNEVQCSMALGFDTKTNPYQDIEKIMVNAESEMYKEKLNLRSSFAQDTISNLIRSLQKKSIREKAHSETVAMLCSEMGKTLGLPEHEVKKLREAGYLHDIGKVALQDEILLKQDLNEHEKQQMHLHPVIGYRILNLFDETLDLAPGIYGHHEKWDGTGYPKGLKGEEIPIISRIISLVESYERKLARYGTSQAGGKEAVFRELREDAGTVFDPELVEKFIQMLEKTEAD